MAASGWRGPRREARRPAAHQAKQGPTRVRPVGHAGRVGRLEGSVQSAPELEPREVCDRGVGTKGTRIS